LQDSIFYGKTMKNIFWKLINMLDHKGKMGINKHPEISFFHIFIDNHQHSQITSRRITKSNEDIGDTKIFKNAS
jgi:hypothetical protein